MEFQGGKKMQHKNQMYFLANQTHTQMMSFVIETADGCVIVVDGGTRGDAAHLLDTLKSITGQEIPHVDAWFLTHSHMDHTGAIIELLEKDPDCFTVEKVYYNFPSVQWLAKYEDYCAHEFYEFRGIQNHIGAAIETITQGDTYQVGEAKFDILYTTDPLITENASNNASAVIRMTLGGQTVMFLGDLGVEAGEKLLKMHDKDTLKSDFVEMAHHGQNGVEKDVYEAIAPRACLWCTPKWLWENDAGKGYNTHFWKTIIVRSWMDELNVKHHFVNKDGDHLIPLPYSFE